MTFQRPKTGADGHAGRTASTSLDGAGDGLLSARELEVLSLLCRGFSCPEIGRKLAITARTARAHVTALRRKLDAATAAQCVARGFERGLLGRLSAGRRWIGNDSGR
jgi:LuxR family transcriptional activator of conjugal transfer of Ti plasmids